MTKPTEQANVAWASHPGVRVIRTGRELYLEASVEIWWLLWLISLTRTTDREAQRGVAFPKYPADDHINPGAKHEVW